MMQTIDDLNRNFLDFLDCEEMLFLSESKGDMQSELKVLAKLKHENEESENRNQSHEKSR